MKNWDNPTSEEQVRKNIGFFKSKEDLDFIQIDTTQKSIEETFELVMNIVNQ